MPQIRNRMRHLLILIVCIVGPSMAMKAQEVTDHPFKHHLSVEPLKLHLGTVSLSYAYRLSRRSFLEVNPAVSFYSADLFYDYYDLGAGLKLSHKYYALPVKAGGLFVQYGVGGFTHWIDGVAGGEWVEQERNGSKYLVYDYEKEHAISLLEFETLVGYTLPINSWFLLEGFIGVQYQKTLNSHFDGMDGLLGTQYYETGFFPILSGIRLGIKI